MPSVDTSPTAMALTRGLPAYSGAKPTSPPRFGTPKQLPYHEIPDTTPSRRRRAPGIVRRREAQRVQDGDGPRAHGEDVAQDAAHPGGGALERLDEGEEWLWLSILRRQREPIPQVHDAGVLTGALQHLGALGGEITQEDAGVLVGAVLGPERGEEAQLGEARLATEPADDAVVLLGGEAVAEGKLFRDLRLGPGHPVPTSRRSVLPLEEGPVLDQAGEEEWKMASPSMPPTAFSAARSGWGIRPSTVPSSLTTPAMFSSEPLGLASLVRRPSSSQ